MRHQAISRHAHLCRDLAAGLGRIRRHTASHASASVHNVVRSAARLRVFARAISTSYSRLCSDAPAPARRAAKVSLLATMRGVQLAGAVLHPAFWSAVTLAGIELMDMIRKGQLRAAGRLRPANQFYSLAS